MVTDNMIAASDIATKTISKLGHRIIPILFLLHVVAYLDRINISFAALTMNSALGITSAQYGLLTGIFFLGYFLFEIPSNLLLHKIGARIQNYAQESPRPTATRGIPPRRRSRRPTTTVGRVPARNRRR